MHEYDDDDDLGDDWESGPYCRHWGDPADCDEPCVNCEHECREHFNDSCNECECEEFEEYDED